VKRLAVLVLFVALSAHARDPAQVRAFRKENPCPATSKRVGACPGWVVNHRWPLCLQPLFRVDLDAPWNMEWEEKKGSYKSDAEERAACKRLGELTKEDRK
jgi:hypothetical protein